MKFPVFTESVVLRRGVGQCLQCRMSKAYSGLSGCGLFYSCGSCCELCVSSGGLCTPGKPFLSSPVDV